MSGSGNPIDFTGLGGESCLDNQESEVQYFDKQNKIIEPNKGMVIPNTKPVWAPLHIWEPFPVRPY